MQHIATIYVKGTESIALHAAAYVEKHRPVGWRTELICSDDPIKELGMRETGYWEIIVSAENVFCADVLRWFAKQNWNRVDGVSHCHVVM